MEKRMRIADLAHKDSVIYGFGREGQSVLAAIRARLPQARLSIVNDTPLEQAPQVPVYSGDAVAAALQRAEVIIKSPGISWYRPELQAARERGALVTSATRLWFAEHPQVRALCITGTKGKSTTSSLCAHVLRGLGYRVALAGNIGAPLFSLPENKAADYYVVELSSYQTTDFDAEVEAALLLNLYPEHLDWHGSVARYFADKLNLLHHARRVLCNAEDANTQAYANDFPQALWFNRRDGLHVRDGGMYQGEQCLLAAADAPLQGRHNLLNICAALALLETQNIAPQRALSALAGFQALPHRLHLLGERDGLRYVDDSISTTPQSARAAVEAFPGQPLTLLLGGHERGLDWTEMLHYIAQHSQIGAVLTLPANGARIAAELRAVLAANGRHLAVEEARDVAAAVQRARQLTPPGGLVLLSPGAPSYGQFNNFQERGRAFAAAAGFGA